TGNYKNMTIQWTPVYAPPCDTPTPTSTPTNTPTVTPTFTPTPIPTCGLLFRRVYGPNPGGDNYLYRVAAISANDVWAVGYYVSGGQQQPLMQHWDGTTWTTVPGPATNNGAFYSVSALSLTDVWAVGANGLVGSSSST